jgi:invasion protein IalB
MGPSPDLNQHSTPGSARLTPILRLMACAALALMALPAAASAQGAVRSVHGDWQIRCDNPPGAQTEQCALRRWASCCPPVSG